MSNKCRQSNVYNQGDFNLANCVQLIAINKINLMKKVEIDNSGDSIQLHCASFLSTIQGHFKKSSITLFMCR